MGRSKIKTKSVKSTVGNKDILDMFQNMVGIGGESDSSMNPKIVFEKYQKLNTAYKRYAKIFDLMLISNAVKRNSIIYDYIVGYVNDMTSLLSELFQLPNYTELQKLDVGTLPQSEHSKICSEYKKIKNSKLTESMIITCKNLIIHKKYIADQDNLDGKFIVKLPGLQFCPVYGAEGINFKILYGTLGINDSDRKYLLTLLHKIYSISYESYNIISSPDVDMEEFVQVILTAVEQVRKQIPRCDAAFNKIIESVDLLRNNFDGYYKDFVSSNNSAVIMENFIIDVSERTEATPKLTAQFRKIISYYRKVAAQQPQTNSKLNTVFKFLDSNMKELEKHTGPDQSGYESDSEEETGAPNLVDVDLSPQQSDSEQVDEDLPEVVTPDFANNLEMLSVQEPDSSSSNLSSDYDIVTDAQEE